MKTTKQVIEESDIPAKLIRAVIRQLGDKDSLEDIYRHGIDGGFHGFIYYSETVPFFKRNRREILTLVESIANDLGENPIDMVAGFNCLAGQERKRTGTYGSDSTPEYKRILNEYRPSVARCLYGGRLTDDDTNVANALAWFAGEEVARAFCDD